MQYILLIFFIILLFLPIFIKAYLYYNPTDKKLYFAIYLFNYIKIIAGYITKRELGGIYIHMRNRAIILDENFFNKHKKDKISLKTFKIDKISLFFDMGYESANTIFLTYALLNLTNIISKNSKTTKIYTYLNVYNENQKIISVYSSFSFHFNIFGIVKGIFANFISKGENYAKTKVS